MNLHIKDFLKDENNCSAAFVEAIAAMAEGDALLLDGGEYHFYPEGTYEKEYYISNNDGGVKPIALPIINKKGITVDGGGAELIFHGMVMPIVIDNSEDITLKGFSIDYATPFYAQAKIVSANAEGALVEFDGKDFNAKVKNGYFCFYSESEGWEFNPSEGLSMEFDENGHPSACSAPYIAYMGEPCDHGFLSWLYKDITLEERGKNLIFMRGSIGERHNAGNHLVMTYMSREYPGIFVTDSKDVSLDDIRLYFTAAMGVIAQTSENISLNKVIAEPREGSGRLLSTNADATHFVNCRGKLSMTNSKFIQMMDDAANVHGIYNLYTEKLPDGSMKLGFGHGQQRGIQVFRVGDRVSVIDSETNEIKAEGCVLEARLASPDQVIVKLDCDVPEPGAHYVTENLSTAPEVYFADCESGYNRPRGFLISTAGKAIIERCKFYNMYQGIQISGEMKDWYESGRITDVCIRDCDFTNAAYAGGLGIICHPELRCTNTVFNKKVTIENNLFVQSEERICSIESCEEVIFKGNRFICDPALPSHKKNGEDGTEFKNCLSVIKEDVLR